MLPLGQCSWQHGMVTKAVVVGMMSLAIERLMTTMVLMMMGISLDDGDVGGGSDGDGDTNAAPGFTSLIYARP